MAEYIEREEVIKAAMNDKAVCQCLADIVDVKDIVNCVPAADVVPVVYGHWKLDSQRNGFHYCDICKSEAITQEDSWGYEYQEILSDYCPWCGAKMDGDTIE